MIPSASVIDYARRMCGTPYRHQGRSKTAVDCIGLLVVVAYALDLFDADLWVPANYSPRPKDGLLEKHIGKVCVPCEGAIAGGIALFKWAPQAPAAHCAILTGETMIHAYKTVGYVVEHGFRGKWPARVHSFYRLPNVDYGQP